MLVNHISIYLPFLLSSYTATCYQGDTKTHTIKKEDIFKLFHFRLRKKGNQKVSVILYQNDFNSNKPQ